MADDTPPADRRAHPDPYGTPPLPDGDRVRSRPPNTPPPSATTRHQLIAALILAIIVAAIVLRVLR
ncbi:hypothetical protein [Salinispora sp. H7-4]|uniref:hypothetical protein n=1 Tax=Salinispora sp. H7-4 TaxID=2748321 RepID=UPI0015D37166|nr:hypothetical protein [Salinispora sp. H7-4]NYT94996.1 hypothetical protein [Salinispora sp. H7-4]